MRCSKIKQRWVFTVLMVPFIYVVSKKVTISNLVPKLDIDSNIVNAHDGTYRRFGSYWYFHGAEYGLCKEPTRYGCDRTKDQCGFRPDHNVSIWRSPDLSSGSWEFVGLAAQCQLLPDCKILYRPHLVFNPTTNLYVLFVNYVTTNSTGDYAVLTSSSPEGPFKFHHNNMNVSRACPGPIAKAPCGTAQGHAGDFDVFVDDDNTGYFVYSATHWISIEQLTPDFLYSTGLNASWKNGAFDGSIAPDYFVEAPVMFKRKGIYYVLYGHCCCFCYQGSGILVFMSHKPMGPWVAQTGGDLACRAQSVDASEDTLNAIEITAKPTPNQGCLYDGKKELSTTLAQQNFVITVPTIDGDVLYIWTGDRWQQAPDKIKGHEGQFWAPLNFNAEGAILNVSWINNFTFNI